ncbi:PREDICTED: dual specificity mitogen-activated protein kinase kinase 6-like [Amphimedon queenslandica]|uniref:mitogen-activated protein kinase kinase n=1 Tax=Amphimedon queenslandica TaxID=400682 RepID=A0A1X7V5U2_AMPQE|nr:PREDICTED: dual specificity mitogen-activated protein kinase kinase 6-like [Amphimedon queenslandica]|eukprot:XP_003385734.1 PREDICTED: dual specificity mitogen-activated protein kinase kinase 6-like [Amphimedon queenslandica]
MPAKDRFKHLKANVPSLVLPAKKTSPLPPIVDLPDATTIQIDDKSVKLSKTELYDVSEIGRGQFGQVNKMTHMVTGKVMAVKRIRVTPDQAKSKSLLMEWKVPKNSVECPYTILFYGAFFCENDVWICMELMDRSLEELYHLVYDKLKESIPELVIGKMALSTLKALTYLHDKLNVMHRDVKPSNILINQNGEIKLCDFGIAGELVDSLAKTDIGCRPYLAPERIDEPQHEYDHRSDVWSLGITMYEIAMGEFPYPVDTLRSIFGLIEMIVKGSPPRLTSDRFSGEHKDFVAQCLTKSRDSRPRYKDLNAHSFIQTIENTGVDMHCWYTTILTKYNDDLPPDKTEPSATNVPELVS